MDTKKTVSKEHLKRAYSDLHASTVGRAELVELSRANVEKAYEMVERLENQPLYYQVEMVTLIAAALCLVGAQHLPEKWANEADPTDVALKFIDNEFDALLCEQGEATENECAAIFLAIGAHFKAVSIFSKPLNELLNQFVDGDDESLLKAIVVDRSVLAIPSVAKRIRLAESLEDEAFFTKLSKAITKTRPARPSVSLDDTRTMTFILDELGKLQDMSQAEYVSLLVDDLQIYDDDNKKDVAGALSKFLQRYRKARTLKP